jgi:hypothetical protein
VAIFGLDLFSFDFNGKMIFDRLKFYDACMHGWMTRGVRSIAKGGFNMDMISFSSHNYNSCRLCFDTTNSSIKMAAAPAKKESNLKLVSHSLRSESPSFRIQWWWSWNCVRAHDVYLNERSGTLYFFHLQ